MVLPPRSLLPVFFLSRAFKKRLFGYLNTSRYTKPWEDTNSGEPDLQWLTQRHQILSPFIREFSRDLSHQLLMGFAVAAAAPCNTSAGSATSPVWKFHCSPWEFCSKLCWRIEKLPITPFLQQHIGLWSMCFKSRSMWMSVRAPRHGSCKKKATNCSGSSGH